MSTSFAALMAVSQAQTAQSQSKAQALAAERKRKQEEERKRAAEADKKRKEEEAKLRARHFEKQKEEAERAKKREEQQKAREAEMERRAEEQKNTLLYGPKKASSSSGSKWPSSSSQAHKREELRKKRLPSEEEEDDVPQGQTLTRQELRERKLQAQLKREFSNSKRSTSTGGYQRHGRKLPGGAVDVTMNNRQLLTDGPGSVKARLSAMPNTLQALNVNKRDTRTIDEIVTDLHNKQGKTKTIEGEQAKEFDDWFGSKKKSQPQSRVGSAAPASGSNTPRSSQANGTSRASPVSSSSSMKKSSAAMSKPIPKITSSSSSKPSRPSTNDKDRDKSDRYASVKTKSKAPTGSRPGSAGLPSASKKRPRSLSRSETPPPKRRVVDEYDSEDLDDDDEYEDYGRRGGGGGGGSGVSDLIWSIMGKDRNRYVKMDVLSDDEDMEADASAVEREEMRSSRIAKREDLVAQEEERRHEEEKRRRRRERGY